MLWFAFREKACVLVHGSEGMDATLLVTALAQVILDPKCRTLAGFQGLIEREWIQVSYFLKNKNTGKAVGTYLRTAVSCVYLHSHED